MTSVASRTVLNLKNQYVPRVTTAQRDLSHSEDRRAHLRLSKSKELTICRALLGLLVRYIIRREFCTVESHLIACRLDLAYLSRDWAQPTSYKSSPLQALINVNALYLGQIGSYIESETINIIVVFFRPYVSEVSVKVNASLLLSAFFLFCLFVLLGVGTDGELTKRKKKFLLGGSARAHGYLPFKSVLLILFSPFFYLCPRTFTFFKSASSLLTLLKKVSSSLVNQKQRGKVALLSFCFLGLGLSDLYLSSGDVNNPC
ncbi:hypothetical protein Tco_0874956 [Tanacetum coccineum]|uniref:Uncharacterized protein n=1 Tax=Tanacetum coccineum TaxID=301880 RepID=A0ABQ5BN85_9ASTR